MVIVTEAKINKRKKRLYYLSEKKFNDFKMIHLIDIIFNSFQLCSLYYKL